MATMTEPDDLYVMARQVLLDALDALGPHRDAIVLVGAQAVYLRVGEAQLAVAPFTTDGDLAIDPSVLAKLPALEQVLLAAGFSPKTMNSVGIWITKRSKRQFVDIEIAVDLLVPASMSPGIGRRAARLSGHDYRAARIVKGLDGALVDSDVMSVVALDVADTRVVETRVAGPAALLVAKVHKIDDRHGTGRESDKDALDIFRLLRGTETDDLSARYRRLLADARSADAAKAGLALLAQQFCARGAIGIQMALRSIGPLVDPAETAASCEILAQDLLTALG